MKVKANKQCKKCPWSTKVNDTLIYCMFKECVNNHTKKLTNGEESISQYW